MEVVMTFRINRRQFITTPYLLTAFPALWLGAQDEKDERRIRKIKFSLNAYSFNRPLRDGAMTIDDLLEFCFQYNLDALDLTAYYFPGYPAIPPDRLIFDIKRKAFLNGLEISGTGIRNDFTEPDPDKRNADIILIRNWIACAAKLGAPVIRVFAGKQSPEEFTREQIITWLVKELRICSDYGSRFGIVVAIQNHNDFIRNAEDVLEILKMVNSDWFGLVLDIGSFRSGDPYEQIARLAHHAVSWQIKENVYINGVEQKVDLKIISEILKESGYRGYIPIETLGEGDPRQKVIRFLDEVRSTLG